MSTSVLFDHPGPKARARYRIWTVVLLIVAALAAYWVYLRFAEAGQWDADLWEPFLMSTTWTQYIIPGLIMTLQAALVAMVLSLAFGIAFAAARLSDHRWISVPAGILIELLRAIPRLLMIFFIFFGIPLLIGAPVSAFWAVVAGLTLCNGSALAEAYRAGIKSIPRGQAEAAYALGMRKNAVMRLVLIPQASRLMLPVIVGQLVVLLKDTALGYIVALPELMQRGVNDLSANYGNVVAASIVVAVIYIIINWALTQFAHYLDRRSTRMGKTDEEEKAITDALAPLAP